MKKLIVLMLAAALVLTACGSESKALTFDEFQEKYKRSDWGVFLSDPVTLYRDFERGIALPKDEWAKDQSVFKDAEYADDARYADVVLFNRPFEVHIWDRDDVTYGGMICYDSDDRAECFAAYKAMFESCIKKLGDPESIRANFEDVNEAEFRKAIETLENYDYFEVKWKYDGGGFTLNFSDFSSHAEIQLASN